MAWLIGNILGGDDVKSVRDLAIIIIAIYVNIAAQRLLNAFLLVIFYSIYLLCVFVYTYLRG